MSDSSQPAEYQTLGAANSTLVLTFILFLERLVYYLMLIIRNKHLALCSFNSCCGLFSAAAMTSDREDTHEKQELPPNEPLEIVQQ